MVYEPEPYQAWIRLWDLPFQAWNTDDLRTVTTGVGRITAVLPHGRRAGHFRHVTIRVACGDPEEISRFLMYHENGHARRVRVQILHWREWQQGPYPLQQNQWPPEQNPAVNPQPPEVNPPPVIPSLSPPDTSSSAMMHATSSDASSGGSNSGQGAAGERCSKKFKKSGKNLRVRKTLLKKMRKKATQKATQVWRQKITKATDVALIQNKSTGVQTQEGSQRVFFVKKSEIDIQIFDKKSGQTFRRIGLTFLPRVHHHNKFSINCSVLLGAEFGDKKFALDLIGQKAEVYRWLQLIGGQTVSHAEKGLSAVMDGASIDLLEYTSAQKENNDIGPEYSASHQLVEEGELLNQEMQLLGLDGWAARVKRLGSKAVSEIIDLDQLFPQEELLHPPGFPTPKYKKKNLEPTRRSPRLKSKQNYGGTKKAKGEKLILEIETRTEVIQAALAIDLIEESGTTLTQEVRDLFFAVQDESSKGQEEGSQALSTLLLNE